MKLRYQILFALGLSLLALSYLNVNSAPLLHTDAQETESLEEESVETLSPAASTTKYIGSSDVLQRKRLNVTFRDQMYGGINAAIPESTTEEELIEPASTVYGYAPILQRKREEVDHFDEAGLMLPARAEMPIEPLYPEIERDRVEVPVAYTGQIDEQTKVLDRKRFKLRYIDTGFRVSQMNAGYDKSLGGLPDPTPVVSAPAPATPKKLQDGKIRLASGVTIEFSNSQLEGHHVKGEPMDVLPEVPEVAEYYPPEFFPEVPEEVVEMPEGSAEPELLFPENSLFFGFRAESEEDEGASEAGDPALETSPMVEMTGEGEGMLEMPESSEEANGGGGIEAGDIFDIMSLFPGIN